MNFLDGILDGISSGTGFGGGIINILIGIAILIVGWIVANWIAGIVRKALGRTNIDNRIASTMGYNEDGTAKFSLEGIIASVVKWVIFFMAVMAFFDRVNLGPISSMFEDLMGSLTSTVPKLLSAAVLAAVFYGIAYVVRMLINSAGDAAGLDNRVSSMDAEGSSSMSITKSLGTIAFWLIIFMGLPAILGQLELGGLLEPVQNLVDDMMGAIPNILKAAIILGIGYFIARIVRQIVSNLLAAVGADSLGSRLGMKGNSLSSLGGTIVFALIIIPVVVSALDALQMAAISGPATQMLNTVMNAIPSFIAAIAVLAISYFIGRFVSNLVVEIASGAGLDSVPARLGLNMGQGRGLSEIIGMLIMAFVMVLAAIQAANMIGFSQLGGIIESLLGLAGNVIVGIIVIGLGLYLANMVRDLVLRAGGRNSAMLANVARFGILALATVMGLEMMGIGDSIVGNIFTILIAAAGVAIALSFGLGAREVAGREAERFVKQLRGE